jgi:putative aldouronate transport system substrate-binding protein
MAACVFTNGTVSNFTSILKNSGAAGVADVKQNIKSVVVTDDQGVWRGAETSNYWLTSIFSPSLDDAKFDRILSLIDYLYTTEAEQIINMGLDGVDWEKNADGGYTNLLDSSYANVREKYPSCWFWRFMALCPDEFSLVNPAEDQTVQKAVNAAYAARAASAAKNGFIKLDYNVNFLGTQAKADYSVNILDEVVRIAVDDKITEEGVAQEWSKFIENYRQIWQPVVDDLNAAK